MSSRSSWLTATSTLRRSMKTSWSRTTSTASIPTTPFGKERSTRFSSKTQNSSRATLRPSQGPPSSRNSRSSWMKKSRLLTSTSTLEVCGWLSWDNRKSIWRTSTTKRTQAWRFRQNTKTCWNRSSSWRPSSPSSRSRTTRSPFMRRRRSRLRNARR